MHALLCNIKGEMRNFHWSVDVTYFSGCPLQRFSVLPPWEAPKQVCHFPRVIILISSCSITHYIDYFSCKNFGLSLLVAPCPLSSLPGKQEWSLSAFPLQTAELMEAFPLSVCSPPEGPVQSPLDLHSDEKLVTKLTGTKCDSSEVPGLCIKVFVLFSKSPLLQLHLESRIH